MEIFHHRGTTIGRGGEQLDFALTLWHSQPFYIARVKHTLAKGEKPRTGQIWAFLLTHDFWRSGGVPMRSPAGTWCWEHRVDALMTQAM